MQNSCFCLGFLLFFFFFLVSGFFSPEDTTHLIQRPCYQWESLCQDPAGNWTTRIPPDNRKETQTDSGMVMSPIHWVWSKPSCKAQWKGEEDKADWGRGGKTTSGNGQAWSSPSPRRQWRTGKNGGNWLRNHLWCPNDPRGLGTNNDDGWWWSHFRKQSRVLENIPPIPCIILQHPESKKA